MQEFDFQCCLKHTTNVEGGDAAKVGQEVQDSIKEVITLGRMEGEVDVI